LPLPRPRDLPAPRGSARGLSAGDTDPAFEFVRDVDLFGEFVQSRELGVRGSRCHVLSLRLRRTVLAKRSTCWCYFRHAI
jgi:hypothetical protein